MPKNTRFRLPALFVAILLQILATESGQTQSSRVTKQSPVPSSQLKPLAPQGELVGAKRNSVKRHEHRERKGDANRKFQARMLTEAEHQQRQHQQQPQSESIKRQDMGSDSWQTHALVPTFTDQEQGDEMIALASDQREPDQVRLPRANRSMPNQRGEPATGQSSQQPSQLGKMTAEAAIKARLNLQDEYEVDEEDEAEEEPARAIAAATEYEPTSGRDPNSKQPAETRKYKQHSGLEYTDHVPQYDQTDKARLPASVAAANRSATSLVRAFDSGWLPTAPGTAALNDPQAKPGVNKGPETSKERPSSVGDRLAGFFGGRDGVNKADAAIEYLRSILKSKQSQLVNSTHLHEYSDSVRAPNLDQAKAERNFSYDRISMLTSRLNKILNTTAVQANGTGEPSKLAEPIPLPINDQGSQLSSLDLFNGKNRQTGTKFSISDAKSAAQHLESLSQQPTPSTKPQSEPTFSPESSSIGQSIRSSQPTSQTYSDQLAAHSAIPANGTPLGGDYIEGLDDYPRYAQEQQQQASPHQRPNLHESQSQLVPIRQEPPKAEQSSDKQRQNLDPYQSQQRPSAQSTASQVAVEASYQQQAPSNLPQVLLNLQRQNEGPRSSRYFQMHQSQAYDELRLSNVQKQNHGSDGKSSVSQENSGYFNNQSKQAAVHQIVPAKQDEPTKSPESAASLFAANRYEEQPQQSVAQKPNHPETNPLSQAQQEHIYRPPTSPVSHSTISSSKIYGTNEPHSPIEVKPQRDSQQTAQYQAAPNKVNEQPVVAQQHQQQQHPAKAKPPKIVSYNYFESPNEGKEGKDSELMATNYQLADALYSSTGELGHMLSNTELEAIQSQFLTAEHPIVPVPAYDNHGPQFNQQPHDQSLAGLLANLRPADYPPPPPEALQKLLPPGERPEEPLKELASSDQPLSLLPPSAHKQLDQVQNGNRGDELRKLLSKPLDLESKKRKSLIVYLNHPRPVDMSKVSTSEEGHNLAQSIGDQSLESFISAKEFDTQGLSKDTTHLDVSNVRGFGDSKEAQDKDGLSVVVIGDAYKYKKIVLLISSKSGGLKFIPMVKDMKK